MNTWCILPVRSLAESKSRLAHILSPEERGVLTGRFVQQTITTLKEVAAINHIMVVSRDPAVFTLVSPKQVIILPEKGKPGLNGAILQASRAAVAMGGERLLVLPADLPFATPSDIEALLAASEPNSIVLATDEVGDGTNAMLLNPPTEMTFQYGVGSYRKHKEAARAKGLRVIEVVRHGLAFDLDTEADWKRYMVLLQNNGP